MTVKQTKRKRLPKNNKKDLLKNNENIKNNDNQKLVQEIAGILIMTTGLLLFCGLYLSESTGIFGQFISMFFLGLLGWPSFLIPPLVILLGIIVILNKEKITVSKRILYSAVLFILISALVHTGYYSKNEYEYINMQFFDKISAFFAVGKDMKGGGAIGGLLSLPFISVFQLLGTTIILVSLSIIDIVLLTNISIAGIIENFKEKRSGGSSRVFKTKKPAGVSVKSKKEKKEIEFEKEDLVSENIMLGRDSLKVIDFKIENKDTDKKENEQLTFDFHDGTAVKNKKRETSVKNEGKKVPPFNKDNISILPTEKLMAGEYDFPPAYLLKKIDISGSDTDYKSRIMEDAEKLELTLKSFGVEAKVINVSRGPAVTRYELQPKVGVKVSRIVNLADDIALNLAAPHVRIEAPIPGKAAVGIEIPNRDVIMVSLRDVIESEAFKKIRTKLAFALGKDISGKTVVADISKMPHLLIAGATGSGKSVCINCLIMSLLYKSSPDDVKLLMIDPKVVELGNYNGIPHLLIPVVTDPKKAAGALNWAVVEMTNRYKLFADKGVRDIKGYNLLIEKGEGEIDEKPLPHIVIIIDELSDLMMTAPGEVEDAIQRLAQMARAAGMHLIIATQRPSVNVITGVIKANIPSRISFAVASNVDSRTILDRTGAEKLLGRGDMLFYPSGIPNPIRLQGAFVTDSEIEKVVKYVKEQTKPDYDEDVLEKINQKKEQEALKDADADVLLIQAADMVIEVGQASVSYVQRKFKVGYARAARIIDQMEERGIIGGFEGSKPRQVLLSKDQWEEMKMQLLP